MGGARCLLVAHTFPPVIGGSAGVYAALAREAEGAIRVLTSRLDHRTGLPLPGWQDADAAAGAPVHRLDLVRPLLPPAAAAGRMVRTLQWAPHALRLASTVARLSRDVDAVCIADDEHVGWLVPFARRVLRRRALIYCHGDDLVEQDARAIRRRQRWFREAHFVIGAGRFAAERLRDAYGMPAERVVLIPNGVDARRFTPMPADPGLRSRLGLLGARVILAPSRLVPRKGTDRLIASLPAIRAAIPEAVVLVGGDGPQREALQAMPAPPGAVRFLGAVAPDDMPALYALAEVVALPNRAEPGEVDGLPLVLLEAQACGLPVVAGRAGGSGEAIEDGETGLLVEGNDPDRIAEAIVRLLADGAFAARLAAAGRARALEAAWPVRARQFLALCR